MGVAKSLVDGAREFACTIYKNMPGALIPNPASDALHMLWDEMCKPPAPPGLPPAPIIPFSGGRCCATYYMVYYDLKPQRNGAWNLNAYQQQVRGVVGGMQTRQTGANQVQYFHIVTACNGVVTDMPITYGNYLGDGMARINRVEALYGGANNCGNPPADYPIAVPAPPEGFTSPPKIINLDDGSPVEIQFNFKPPAINISPIVNLPPVIVNVLKPEINFNVPIQFDFDGNVNIGKPDGGGDGFGQPDRDKIDDIDDKVDNLKPPIDELDRELRDLKDKYEKDKDRDKNKPIDPADYQPSPPPKPPGKHKADYLAAVEITLTEMPRNRKTQSGSGAPDVVYAGWFEFQRLGKSLPREPIHFSSSVFLAPEGVDGYAFTLYNGYQGAAKEIINKPEETSGG